MLFRSRDGELIGDVAVHHAPLVGGSISGAQVAELIDELPMLAALGPFTENGIEIRDAPELRAEETFRRVLQFPFIGLEHPDLRYEIFFGASDNARGFWDNAAAFRYGYRPTGRAEDYAEAALAAQKSLAPDHIGDLYEGGPFCSDEFDGDPDAAMT